MAKLTTKSRKHLSKKSFAEPSKRAFPINDKDHARNALARVSQFGSPEEKAKVRGAVNRKYPGIGKDKAAYEKAGKGMRR
jgi:hypothetical protein